MSDRLKTSLGIWALGPMVTRFVAGRLGCANSAGGLSFGMLQRIEPATRAWLRAEPGRLIGLVGASCATG
jgi:hypothetical protein